MDDLHKTYAPILRFAKGEQFFPTRVDRVLDHSALYRKDKSTPLAERGQVEPETLAHHAGTEDVFLRSVQSGPIHGPDVAAQWSKRALELTVRLAQRSSYTWTEELARKAYRWFSPKTVGATQLFWWNKFLAPLLEEPEGRDEGLPRLILPGSMRDEAAERSAPHQSEYTYYYRHIRDGAYLCLQYWFFYAYNDWARGFGGMNDHEGDWESLMLFFQLDRAGQPLEPPAYVTFVGHHSRITKPWDHPDVSRIGTHVIGHVAAGSHAAYPQAKAYPIIDLYGLVDHATGDGVPVNHAQWMYRIPLDDVPWLTSYRGSWGTRYWLPMHRAKSTLAALSPLSPLLSIAGSALLREIELPGVSAPHGPMIGDDGSERPQWRQPVAWGGVPGE
jgi:hypothetical protein